MSASRLVIRGTTANCPGCFRWHDVFYVQMEQDRRKFVVFCQTNRRKPKRIFSEYYPIEGIPEYIIPKSEEYVFIKEGFKILKKSDYMRPKLF